MLHFGGSITFGVDVDISLSLSAPSRATGK
jgi:hypothetical protein